MKSSLTKFTMLALLASGLLASRALGQQASAKPEEVEWTWEVRPGHVNASLPNVLLVGDSITRNYYPEVQRELVDEANVYLFAASTSVGDPRLRHELLEFASMERVPFRVVHFNNGMHGWTYTEDEYRAAFPGYLRALHKVAPKATFLWGSITPVKAEDKPGPTNARIEERNKIALSFVRPAGIAVDDQYQLMTHHGDQYADHVHFNAAGAVIQGQQATQLIRAALVRK
ncbi:GDSL-like Lipase/Acylhydrolase family protein [Bryocella elongata]|uniref:GDSL-like Lipase/Acylhydrolase family protein n=1 Tax=Bryocella elongata TaxID=863522 RepID=A0A1H6B9M1_9BACT|nr:SGNH/GDSL hydrolase family protein [Bryocella elongata]SEG57489.1 GDSL-like Lipase/Acylhydrolase family protein [Bryocella elongata]